jgi:hypothetical protein
MTGKVHVKRMSEVHRLQRNIDRNLEGQGKPRRRRTTPLTIEIDERAALVVVRQYDRDGLEVAVSNINVPRKKVKGS